MSSNQFRSRLQSSQQGMLLVPACHSSLMQSRGFAISGPSEWNRLPTAVWVLAADGVTAVNSIQKIICIALRYRISITGGPAQFSIYLESQEKYAFLNK